ncbi:MAG: ComF family protein [Bacteriovoracia bacterium]
MSTNYNVFPIVQKLLFSPLCLGCGKTLREGQNFCFACRKGVRRALTAEEEYLLNFSDSVPPLFHGLRKAAPHYASRFLLSFLERAPQLKDWRKEGIEMVITAPQRAQDGPSGLALVGEGTAQLLGAEFLPGFLAKEKGRAQHGRNFSRRVDTHCFVSIAGKPEKIRGKKILVLDDVLTSGTTLDLSGYVLRKAGAKWVRAFALAHQVMPGLEGKREQAHEEGHEVHPLLLHLRV